MRSLTFCLWIAVVIATVTCQFARFGRLPSRMPWSCRCTMREDKAHICAADFNIVGRAVSMYRHGPHLKYVVQVSQNFDLKKTGNKYRSMVLTSPIYSRMCGFPVSMETEMFFNGHYRNGNAVITMCGYNKFWHSVPDEIKKGLTNQTYCDHYIWRGYPQYYVSDTPGEAPELSGIIPPSRGNRIGDKPRGQSAI